MSDEITVPTSEPPKYYGLRQEMISLHSHDAKIGGVDVGAGLGSDAILLTWGKRARVVRGRDLLRAWVETFAPDEAERIPS